MKVSQSRGWVLIGLGLLCAVAGAVMGSNGIPKGGTPWSSLYDESGRVLGGPTVLAADSVPAADVGRAPAPTPVDPAAAPSAPATPDLPSSPTTATEVNAPEGGEPRLLRSHGVLLSDDGGAAGHPFRWTTTDARVAAVTIRTLEDRELAAEATIDGEPQQIATFQCGSGACNVLANQREDGSLILRFKSDAFEGDGGAVACVLAVLDDSSGTFGPTIQSRWEGTAQEYGAGSAPTWTRIAPERGAGIPTDSVPAVSCSSESECLRMASTLWLARNHRYAIAYAREAIALDPGSVRSLYIASSAYADAGDTDRSLEFLTQLSQVGTSDASSALRRASRDDAFEAIRGDSRFQALVSSSPR